MTPANPQDSDFDAKWKEHLPVLEPMLRRLAGRHLNADELVTETMLAVWKRIEDYDRDRDFAAWVRGFAWKVRLSLWTRRRRTRQRPLGDEAEAVLEVATTSLNCSMDTELAEALQACLADCTAKERQALEVTYSQGLAGPQAAALMGFSHEAFRKFLSRTRQKLRMCICGILGITSGGGK